MECTGIAAQWCPNCGECSCPGRESGDPPEGLNDPSCPLHRPDSNHPLPSEGRVVVIPPTADPEVRVQCEIMGIPVIAHPGVPEGMMFVIDLDELHGREPLEARTARQAEEFMAKMREFVKTSEYNARFGQPFNRPESNDGDRS